MVLHLARSTRRRLVLPLLVMAFTACSGPSPGKAFGLGEPQGDGATGDAGEGDPTSDPSITTTSTAAPSSYDATAPSTDPAPSSQVTDAGSPAEDESASDADAIPDGACSQPLAPGSLMIDELMIEPVKGSGDYGEWFEVTNLLDCAVDLRGLHGECPHGAKVVSFDVSEDIWVPAQGFFVVADSLDPTVNHDLPGIVIGWLGTPHDVLRHDGTTLTLSLAGAIIDTLTYPALKLTVGASVEFPGGCDASDRSDFTKWQTATASWFPGFLGTPGAPNTDVSCQ